MGNYRKLSVGKAAMTSESYIRYGISSSSSTDTQISLHKFGATKYANYITVTSSVFFFFGFGFDLFRILKAKKNSLGEIILMLQKQEKRKTVFFYLFFFFLQTLFKMNKICTHTVGGHKVCD